MSNGSDPSTVLAALDRAEDAFEEVGHGVPHYEKGIESGGGWETQLTKACKLLDVIAVLQEQNGYYTAVIELCFGAIERSIEAYAVGMGGDEVEDFRDHEYSYERAHEVGLFEKETADALMYLYDENRTESYYGGGRPTNRQTEAMSDLAREIHRYVVDQIREGGVCICE
jgi:hypothetical protein